MSLDIYLLENEKCVFSANITHNLNEMAQEANIYNELWYPETNGIETAGQLIHPLANGISKMGKDPHRFEKFNSPNGWGLYENFLPWLNRLLIACKENPSAIIVVSN